MAWIEMDYSKDTRFRWNKSKWWLEDLGVLGIMGETSADPLMTDSLRRL